MSLRKAINAKCKECIYDPVSGNGSWRKQVEQCTSFNCPLWPARPKTTSGTSKRRKNLTVRKKGENTQVLSIQGAD